MLKNQKGYDFEQTEEAVRKAWEEGHYFEKLVKKNEHGERFRFLDGPITANNPMGIHHAFGRTLKDITIRYNSMKGRSCQFQNGFDAQGLWVEVEVEKELGFVDKKDIVDHGMGTFTKACLARVDKYGKVITEQSKHLGQWMDWEHSYYTNTDDNILGIWHFLKKCHEKGWIVKKNRVMSWCPRCGTSLSEHEMSGNYKEMTHESVFFRMPLEDQEADLLVWTTTPWTLTANSAVAVHPELDYVYVQVEENERPVILCSQAMKRVLKGKHGPILKTVKGKDLLDKTYVPLFGELEVQKFTHRVIAWTDIVADEGTGLVHIAPGCGEEDFELGKTYALPAICPINEAGVIEEGYGKFSGQTTTQVMADIFERLDEDKRLFQILPYNHKYPTCWRCKTPIVFKLVDEWYIRTDDIRPQLLEAVETVEWQPKHVKKRMIDWLNNMSDWNISRKRFYGLPLPFYVCPDCGKTHVIGSLDELADRSSKEAVDNLTKLHRPWIDAIKVRCDCGALVERIPEVGDCWLDAGITPFVTKGYFTDRDYWRENFPNDVVIEMIEQVRLWFYSMLFMSVTLEGVAPYKKVVAYGSVVREDGEKFSKSAGKDKNILLDDAIRELGADTIRYLYAQTSSINDLRFGYGLGDDAKRKLMAFWNTYTFFDLYASVDQPDIAGFFSNPESLKNLQPGDVWLLGQVAEFVDKADVYYANHTYGPVQKAFEQLVDDMNNWYIRTNRKRFWKGTGADQQGAYATLYMAIKTIVQVMAPIVPFMMDALWHQLVRHYEASAPESVHLSDFPSSDVLISLLPKDKAMMMETVKDQVKDVRELISLGQKLRNQEGLMVKQPLSKIVLDPVLTRRYEGSLQTFEDTLLSELNLKTVECVGEEVDMKTYLSGQVSVNFRRAGSVLKKEVNALKDRLQSMDSQTMEALVKTLEERPSVRLDGFDMDLPREVFHIEDNAMEGYVMETIHEGKLLLDTRISTDLHEEYLVRFLIRQLQLLRKEKDFAIDSRIRLELTVADRTLESLLKHYEESVIEELLVEEWTVTVKEPEYDAVPVEGKGIKKGEVEQGGQEREYGEVRQDGYEEHGEQRDWDRIELDGQSIHVMMEEIIEV